MVTTQTQVVTQNTGVTQTEPPPKEEVPPEATKLPKFKDEVKKEKLERINKRIHKEEYVPPPDTVDYGLRGAPSINYTQVVTAAGTGGVAMGDGNSFGLRYAWYVAAMRNRISGNWLMNTVSPNIQTAPRTNMTFAINRDGSISDVQITQSSGIPEVDRSALRAVIASTPLPPLPRRTRLSGVAASTCSSISISTGSSIQGQKLDARILDTAARTSEKIRNARMDIDFLSL